MRVTTIGIDLAKTVFHLCGMSRSGHVVWRKKVSRSKLLPFLAQQERCVVAMECCAGSHHLARMLRPMGHTPKIIAAQFVKPFVKSNKNDTVDAEAIAEAAQRPQMRFVPMKTLEQQDIQSMHRIRDQLVKMRTALVNQCRGLLGEYGVVIPKGRTHLMAQLSLFLEEDRDDGLTAIIRGLLRSSYAHLQSIEERILPIERQLTTLSRTNEQCLRLTTIPGVGPLTATALVAAVGNAQDFKNGRQMSAWLGLVPKQVSTGGKTKLLGISKRGDCYLRKLFIHGARAVASHPSDLGAPQDWVRRAEARMCRNKAVVGLANKNVRIAWAILTRGETFRKSKAFPSPQK